MEEKGVRAFGLYDINDNGKISYEDMLLVVRAIYEMVRYCLLAVTILVVLRSVPITDMMPPPL